MFKDPRWNPGYEYRTVGECWRTGRPFLSPKAWNNQKWGPPIYATCSCCGDPHGGRRR